MPAIQDNKERNTPADSRSTESGNGKWWLWGLLICLLVVGGGSVYWTKEKPTAGINREQAKPPSAVAVPVQATAAKKGDISVYLNGLGNVTPLNTVTVRSRVDGQLMEVHYREGDNVAKGSLLGVIDPRPFKVQLTQAEGQMARDREQLNNARLDLQRYKQLWEQDSIPRQQFETQQALVRQLEGTVKVDQGQIDNARLQLTYSRITAPISGRVGLRQVDAGNIVHAGDANGLVVITQMQPIAVVFPIPEDSLPQVQARLRQGGQLRVEAYDRDQKNKIATGSLLTIDNQIDPTTGTVKFKAVFPNRNNELFPNQFVNARLLVEIKRDSIVIPAAAVQRGPQGTFVYVLKNDKTVSLRLLTLGVTQGGEVAVASGLEAGELVVVDGADRLREGSRVEVKGTGKGGEKRGTP